MSNNPATLILSELVARIREEQALSSTIENPFSDLLIQADLILADEAGAEDPATVSDEKLPSQLTDAKKRESRKARWERAASDAETAVQELVDIQEEFAEWQGNLPENLQDSPLGEKLEAIANDLDLDSALSTIQDAVNADLPLGFGRD